MNTKRNTLIALLAIASFSAQAAGPRWWHQLSSSTVKKDTQVSLQDATGATRTVLSNPAASKAAPGVGSSNQPLTVVVQATTGYWKDPVADWATLTGLPVANNKVGDARQVLNIKRAFTWDGSAWQPLAADQNNVMKAGKFQVGDIVTEGNRCSDNTNAAPGPADIALNGQIARDANGLILSCQSGSWEKTGSKPIATAVNATNNCGSSNLSLSVPSGRVYQLTASGWCWGTGNQCQLFINGNLVTFQQNPSGWGATVASGWTDISTGNVNAIIAPIGSSGTVGCFKTAGRLDITYW